MSLHDVSRAVARALRHEPGTFGLVLDEQGWASVDALLDALRARRPEWALLQRSDLERMIAESAKQRYEIQGERIRAFYGHSTPGRIAKLASDPPPTLYHGTAPSLVETILAEGLVPMKRQYVHLSADVETALAVGRRRNPAPVILTVAATEAAATGVQFRLGNDTVWLADRVPPGFLGVHDAALAGPVEGRAVVTE